MKILFLKEDSYWTVHMPRPVSLAISRCTEVHYCRLLHVCSVKESCETAVYAQEKNYIQNINQQ